MITDAVEALKVSHVFVAAWFREYRRSGTFVKLDDIMTPVIRRTRSVPQGDPCAADLFGAALDIPATAFCERCQMEKWELPVGEHYMSYFSLTTVGLSRCLQQNSNAWLVHGMNSWKTAHRVGRSCMVFLGT